MPQIRYGDAVYCSVDDVRKLFRKEGAFGTDTNPSDNEVLDFIHEATTTIDDYTRYSFRENRVIEENKSFDGRWKWTNGRPLVMSRHPIRTPLDDTKGDKLEMYDGNEWTDWVAESQYTEGRNGSYWVEDDFIIWIYRRFTWTAPPHARVTYRFGEDRPTTTETLDDGTSYEVIDKPRSIRRACSKLVAIDLISSDQYTQLIPGGEGAPSPSEAMQKWEGQVYGTPERDGILDRYKVDPAWVEPL